MRFKCLGGDTLRGWGGIQEKQTFAFTPTKNSNLIFDFITNYLLLKKKSGENIENFIVKIESSTIFYFKAKRIILN